MSDLRDDVMKAIAEAQDEFDHDAHIPHWGRHLATAAIEALRAGAEDSLRALKAAHQSCDPHCALRGLWDEDMTDIINAILGNPQASTS